MTTAEHDHHDDQIGHIVPVKFLALICGILLFLTAVTVWVSRYDFADINISELNIIVAMIVATIKATLVGLYFMHLRWDRPIIGFIFVLSILLVGLMIGLTMTDSMAYQDQVIKGDTPKVTNAVDNLKEH